MEDKNSRKNGPVVIVTAAEKVALAKVALDAAKAAMKEAKAEAKAEGVNTSPISRAAKLSALVTEISAMTPEQAKTAALAYLTGEATREGKAKVKKDAYRTAWFAAHPKPVKVTA